MDIWHNGTNFKFRFAQKKTQNKEYLDKQSSTNLAATGVNMGSQK